MAVVVDELIIRLIADGVEKAKKELLDAAKAAADAQKKLTNTEEQEAAKQAKIQEQKAKKAEAEAKKAAKAIEQAQKKASAAARQGTQEFFGALEKIDGFFTSIATKAALGIAAIFGGAAASVKSFIDEASELKTIASFTSLSTQEFQGLAYAMEQNGLSAEKLADGFRQFNAGFRESTLSGGKGAVAEGIKDLGLSFEKMKRLRPQEQLFAILEAANKAGPSMARAGTFARIFGEIAGANLSRIADLGVPAIKALIAEAGDLGFVLSTDAVESGIKLKQQFGQLTGAAEGLRNAIALELLPIISETIPKIRDWVVQNRELIAQNVKLWLGEIVALGKQFLPWIKAVVPLMLDLVKLTKEWGPALIASAAALKTLLALRQVTGVVTGLAGAFAAARSGAVGLAGMMGPGGALLSGALAFLPVALQIGEALGDIGSFESKARKSIQQKLADSPVNALSESFAGEELLAQELAELPLADRKALKQATSARSRVARAPGSTTSPEDKRQIIAMFKVLEEADFISSKREQKASDEQNQKRLAENLGRYTNKELKALFASGQLTKEQFDLERGQRNASQFMNKRPDAEKKVTDEELAKLIASATKSGANLDELLKGRKIAGGVPPVITLRMFEFKINAPITVNGQPGQSTTQLATAVADEFTNRLERELQKHTPSILEAR
jgi:hypothetical protein